jgi:hypothetical protein
MINVLLCSARSLLMDQVEVTESCLFMGIQFEQCSRSSKLVGSGNGVIPSIKNVPRPIAGELAKLE